MKPIAPRGPSPLTREERKRLTIPFIAVTGRRRHGSTIPAWEAELVENGVDPGWSLEQFDVWVEEGEAEEEKR